MNYINNVDKILIYVFSVNKVLSLFIYFLTEILKFLFLLLNFHNLNYESISSPLLKRH